MDTVCKSAGTLLALGAKSVVMSDRAELGPLDIQISEKDELGENRSGLIAMEALQTLRSESFKLFEDAFLKLRFKSGLQITTKTAAEIAAKITVGLFSPIYEQVDPMRLGEINRAMKIALAYGDRLKTDNVKEDTIEELITDYPEHGFVVDRSEATELFYSVREPSQDEAALAELVRSSAQKGLHGDEPVIISISGELAKRVESGGEQDVGKDGNTDSRGSEEKRAQDESSAGSEGQQSPGPDTQQREPEQGAGALDKIPVSAHS